MYYYVTSKPIKKALYIVCLLLFLSIYAHVLTIIQLKNLKKELVERQICFETVDGKLMFDFMFAGAGTGEYEEIQKAKFDLHVQNLKDAK